MAEVGFCQCGCGKETGIARESHLSKGIVRGKPLRFLRGHQRRNRFHFEEAVPFKIDGELCRFIRLTSGFIAIVDADMYECLSMYPWHSYRCRDHIYACRKGLAEDGALGCQIRMHRQILGLPPGDPREGDHINGNTFDNRRSNLRIADDLGTARNAGIRCDNTSGFKGVQRKGNGWRFRIWTDAGRYHSGSFATPQEAFTARCEYAAIAHGEFVRFQ